MAFVRMLISTVNYHWVLLLTLLLIINFKKLTLMASLPTLTLVQRVLKNLFEQKPPIHNTPQVPSLYWLTLCTNLYPCLLQLRRQCCLSSSQYLSIAHLHTFYFSCLSKIGFLRLGVI